MVGSAERLARTLLARDPQRLAHVRRAAWEAEQVAAVLPDVDRTAVVAAAWLHDIGYVPALVRTGFHPLDGALHLVELGWPERVVRLVAHHSHAQVLAPYSGVEHHLTVLEPVGGLMADVVTYADVVSGRHGEGTTAQARIDELRVRHAGMTVPPEVREERYRLLLDAAARVERRATRHGLRPDRRPLPTRPEPSPSL